MKGYKVKKSRILWKHPIGAWFINLVINGQPTFVALGKAYKELDDSVIFAVENFQDPQPYLVKYLVPVDLNNLDRKPINDDDVLTIKWLLKHNKFLDQFNEEKN